MRTFTRSCDNEKSRNKKIDNTPKPMECECLFWAGTWSKEEMLENKHHKRCEHRK